MAAVGAWAEDPDLLLNVPDEPNPDPAGAAAPGAAGVLPPVVGGLPSFTFGAGGAAGGSPAGGELRQPSHRRPLSESMSVSLSLGASPPTVPCLFRGSPGVRRSANAPY